MVLLHKPEVLEASSELARILSITSCDFSINLGKCGWKYKLFKVFSFVENTMKNSQFINYTSQIITQFLNT